ncbi:CD151 antigen, partial [Exaiptasia diaphana]
MKEQKEDCSFVSERVNSKWGLQQSVVQICMCPLLEGINHISDELLNGIRGKINQYGFADDVTEAIDELQKKYHCCGDISANSWNTTAWKQSELSGNNTVPDSCCKTFSNRCGVRDHPSNINTQ